MNERTCAESEKNGEYEQDQEKATGFIVKEKAGQHQVCVAQLGLTRQHGKPSKHRNEKHPKV
tara:strand:+ start:24 stop:209 length:186 start_codon:yes stop_codon:yes gene_type:complete